MSTGEELNLLGHGEQPLLHIAPMRKYGSKAAPIPPRHHLVLALHLSGKTAEEIAEICSYSKLHVYQILKSEAVNTIRQQLMEGVQMEFDALYEKVLGTIKRNLDSPDETIQLQAVNAYLRERGRIKGQGMNVNITAEDVVVQILNMAGSE